MWQIQSQPTPIIYQGGTTPAPPGPPTADLLIWYKPETLTEAAGDDIPVWPDSSGNGNNAVTNSTAPAPAVRALTTINGHRGVRMNEDAGNMQSMGNVFSGAQNRTMYFVYVIRDRDFFGSFDCGLGQFYDGTIGGQISSGINHGSFLLQERPTDSCPAWCPFWTGWVSNIAMNVGQTFDNARLITATYDNSITTTATYFNSVASGSLVQALNTVSNYFSFGCLDDGSANTLPMDLLEVLAYGVLHDSTTRAVVENYLKTKYAI